MSQASAQAKANSQAEDNAKKQLKAAEEANNRANQKQPDTSALLSAQPDLADTASFYTRYVARLGEALHRAAAQLPEQDDRDALARCALELAVQSYASQLAARELLGLLAAAPAVGEEPEQGKEKKNQR